MRKKVILNKNEKIVNVKEDSTYLVLSDSNEITGNMITSNMINGNKINGNKIKSNLITKKVIFNIISKQLDLKINFYYISTKNEEISINIHTICKNKNSKIVINMEGICINKESKISFIPSFDLTGNDSSIIHKTIIGHVYSDWYKYLQSRGLDSNEISKLLIR